MLEKAPETFLKKGSSAPGRVGEKNEMIYIAAGDQDIDLQLEENLFS